MIKRLTGKLDIEDRTYKPPQNRGEQKKMQERKERETAVEQNEMKRYRE